MAKEQRQYLTQRPVGVWLLYIGTLIIVSALTGGERLIQPLLLGIGFAAGYYAIFGLPYVSRKLAYGKNTKKQDQMENYAVLFNVVFCTLCGVLIGFDQPRTVWLSIFIVVGVHFFGFYLSQGKWMIYLGVLTILNSVIGLWFGTIPFLLIALMDGVVKIGFGLRFLTAKRSSFDTIENA